MLGSKITARNFVHTLAVNVNNKKLTDEAFRELVRNTVAHVEGGQSYGGYALVKEVDGVSTYKKKQNAG